MRSANTWIKRSHERRSFDLIISMANWGMQENAQVSSPKQYHGSQNSQQPSPFVHQLLSIPSTGNRHGSQRSHDFLQADHQGLRVPFNLNVSAQKSYSAGNGDVKIEFHQPHVKVILPSFIHKLLDHNVQDSAGNTSGARFVSSVTSCCFCAQDSIS